MTEDDIERQWQEQYQEVVAEVVAWRRAHPKATLNEIEAAVDERLNRLRARMLTDTATVAKLSDGQEEQPICPKCGAKAGWRGEKTRRLHTQGGEAIQLHRRHAVCPQCGEAFFPPG